MDTSFEPSFSTRLAAQLAGITGNQLHTWCSIEAAIPSIDPGYRQGRPKKWSFSDLVGLRVLRELIGAGMCPPLLGNILPALRTFTLAHPGFDAVTGAIMILQGNGDVHIALEESEVAALAGPTNGTILRALIIELGPAVRDVRTRMVRADLHEHLEMLEDLALQAA